MKYLKRISGAILISMMLLVTEGGIQADAAAASTAAQAETVVPQLAESGISAVYDSGTDMYIRATGEYSNWEGVSNVSEFLYPDGNFCYAYPAADGSSVQVVRTLNGQTVSSLALPMRGSLFGAVTADSNGNYYVISGTPNNTNDLRDDVFIDKFDATGNLTGRASDNGSCGLPDYYGDSFFTKIPFDGGNCDAAVNGKLLAVNYAREMYSGHQSNNIFAINTDTMQKVGYNFYNSHSFGQRAMPYKDGFVFMSEGDCYDRAFSVARANASQIVKTADIFDFYTPKNTLNNWDMYTLNNNYAAMGDLAVISNSTVAFAAASAPSLDASAPSQKQQLFIQVFNPDQDLASANAYRSGTTRKGIGGPNGDENKTNYGVQWLTQADECTYEHPQLVFDGYGRLILLFEQYKADADSWDTYDGVYYMILDANGNPASGKILYSKEARLNPCETPIVTPDGAVYWTGNSTSVPSRAFVYRLKLQN